MMILLEIFWVFFRVSVFSFGGIFGLLPQIERAVVDEHGWITREQFIQAYGLSQFLPGPNSMLCPLIGYLAAGWPGFAAGFLGLYLAPVVIMGLVFTVYRRYRSLVWVRRAELAMRPVVLGLVGASAARLWWIDSAGPGPDAAVGRLIALPLTAAAIVAYVRGWLGPLTVLFAMGVAWWLVARLVT